jgi:hypothetical protein
MNEAKKNTKKIISGAVYLVLVIVCYFITNINFESNEKMGGAIIAIAVIAMILFFFMGLSNLIGGLINLLKKKK